MILMVGWVLLVLVVPVLLNLVAAYASPAPSRAELATRTRVATALAMRDHAALLSTDYGHMAHSPNYRTVSLRGYTDERQIKLPIGNFYS